MGTSWRAKERNQSWRQRNGGVKMARLSQRYDYHRPTIPKQGKKRGTGKNTLMIGIGCCEGKQWMEKKVVA